MVHLAGDMDTPINIFEQRPQQISLLAKPI